MITIPGRIPVRIHPFFWVLCFGIGWINSFTVQGTLIWAVVVFFSVLIHELGHAFAALAFKQRAIVNLYALGGVTERIGQPLLPWQEFMCVLCGPLAGFGIVFVAYFLKKMLVTASPVLQYSLEVAFVVNLVWTVLNLFPVHPLDGGKLFALILQKLFGFKGVKWSLLIGAVLGLCLALLFFVTGALFAGAIFLMLAYEGFQAWKNAGQISEWDQKGDIRAKVALAEKLWIAGQKEEAKEIFSQVREETKGGVLFSLATLRLAEAAYAEGKPEKGLQILEERKTTLGRPGLKLKLHFLIKTKRWKEAQKLGAKLFTEEQEPEVAAMNAQIGASIGDERATFGWLRTLKKLDTSLFNQTIQKQEFSSYSSNKEFLNIVSPYT